MYADLICIIKTRKYHQQLSHLIIDKHLQSSTPATISNIPIYNSGSKLPLKITKENYISAIMHEKSCISFSICGYGNRNVFNPASGHNGTAWLRAAGGRGGS
jgi:hypothetical protein